MTITRIINGKPMEITLTPSEIWLAHREWEQDDTAETVRDIAEEVAKDEDLEPFTDEEILYIVDELRDRMDNGMYIWGSDDIRRFVRDYCYSLREEEKY